MKQVYFLIIFGKLLICAGNAYWGKKFSKVDAFSVAPLLFAGKLLASAIANLLFTEKRIMEIPTKTMMIVLLVGMVMGFGELMIVKSLKIDAMKVAAWAWVFPIALAGFSWWFGGEPPKPKMALAIGLSAIAVALAN